MTLATLSLLLVQQYPGPAHAATTFGTRTGLPGADPNDNIFSKLLQLQNGSTWLVWEKSVSGTGSYGEIYMMVNNGFGWGAQIPVVVSSYDDIDPAIAQLNNGTVVLVWSRGTSGSLSSYNLYTQSFSNGRWSAPTALVTNSPANLDATLWKMSDGSIWLVWSRSTTANGNGDLYYKILRNGAWTPEAIIPTASTSTYSEALPSITQSADGSVLIGYQTNVAGYFQIYLTKYKGTTWSMPVPQLTSTSNSDDWPSITMDRNGSLWVFWAREMPNGTTPPPQPQPQYQWDIYYKTSTNNGTSWTADTLLYNNINTDEQRPSVFQGPDKQLWVVFDSCCNFPGNPYGNPNIFIIKSNLIPAHDLAPTAIALNPNPNPRVGENVTFTITVSNLGEFSDTTTLSFYLNTTLLGTRTLTISAGGTSPATFTWNTAGHKVGNYPIRATVSQIRYEVLTLNNNLNSTFLVCYKGDVNRDGRVNIQDLSTVAAHFGAVINGAGYLSIADLNNDGIINIIDLSTVAAYFGLNAQSAGDPPL